MIKEDYVSYEVAKLLKEKEFEQHKCQHSYDSNGIFKWSDDLDPHEYSAPTHQMALKWLREMHGIFIAINNDDLDFNWQCYDLINRGNTLDPKILSESYAGYKTYEEAVEAALKYSLENLI